MKMSLFRPTGQREIGIPALVVALSALYPEDLSTRGFLRKVGVVVTLGAT